MCRQVPMYVGAWDSPPLLFETRFLNEPEALLSHAGQVHEFQASICLWPYSPSAGVKGIFDMGSADLKAGPHICTAGTWPHSIVFLIHQLDTIYLVKSMGHKQIRNETPEERCGLLSFSRTSTIYPSIHPHCSLGWFGVEVPGIWIWMFPLR